jgi:hypothetical protein
MQPAPLVKYLTGNHFLLGNHQPAFDMRTTTFSLFNVLILASCMLLTGCTGNQCKDVVCINGECVEGECVCDAGYEGLDCGTAVNAKLSGNYTSDESCTLAISLIYGVAVAPKSGSPTEFTMTGLWQEAQAVVTAKVGNDGTSFTIENQPLGSSGFNIASTQSGTISADGDSLTIFYTIYNGTTVEELCTGYMTR